MSGTGNKRPDLGSNKQGVSFVRLIDPIKFMVEYAIIDRITTELRAMTNISRQDAEKIAVKIQAVSQHMVFTDTELLRLVEHRISAGQSAEDILAWFEKLEGLFEE